MEITLPPIEHLLKDFKSTCVEEKGLLKALIEVADLSIAEIEREKKGRLKSLGICSYLKTIGFYKINIKIESVIAHLKPCPSNTDNSYWWSRYDYNSRLDILKQFKQQIINYQKTLNYVK